MQRARPHEFERQLGSTDLVLQVDLVLVTESDLREEAAHFGTLAQIVVDEGRTVYAC